MQTLDLIILAVYFAVVFGIGVYFFRRARTSKSYFLADRSVGWIAVGASLFASNISSEHFIGLAGSGASSGLAVGSFEWLAVFMGIILGVGVRAVLPAERGVHDAGVSRTPVRACLPLVSDLGLGDRLRGHEDFRLAVRRRARPSRRGRLGFYTSATVMVIATGIYTIFGGLAAVIYTELLQAVVLIAGAVVLTLIGLNEIGGMSALRAAVPADFFHMIKPASDPSFPWTGIFLGAPILGIWYWCTDQMIVQRVLGAKSEAHARGGALLCGALKILPVFVLVLPGLIARALYPDISGDEAYPTLMIRLLPPGLTGFMVAALMAALMSSLAATFNSASTLVTFDVYKVLRPAATEAHLVRAGRLVTVVMVALSMLWVPFIKYLSSEVYIYLQSVQAYISPPIAAVFLVGVLWPRANRYGAIASLVVGAVLGAARFILELNKDAMFVSGSPLLSGFVSINFLHIAVLLFVVSLAILVAVSLATQPESLTKLRGLTFFTLEESYRPTGHQAKAIFTLQLVATIALALFTIGLWVRFA